MMNKIFYLKKISNIVKDIMNKIFYLKKDIKYS